MCCHFVHDRPGARGPVQADEQRSRNQTPLEPCSRAQRREIFRFLRREFPIHALETQLNTKAEIILEAIARAGGLTLRMMRGVIAEAAFRVEVVKRLKGWQSTIEPKSLAYDFRLMDERGAVRVQVKLQRSRDNRPMRERGEPIFFA